MDKQQAEELANQLENLLSGLNRPDKADPVAERLTQVAHRTNQQSIMRFCVAYIKAMAKNRSDLRNEASVELAKALAKVPELDNPLPYV